MGKSKAPDLPLQGICERCRKRRKCDAPCAPVEAYLRHENSAPMEKQVGDDTILLLPRKGTTYRSVFETFKESGDPSEKAGGLAFSTENESVFLSCIEPKLKQTCIFLDRFFYGLSPQQAAEKYEAPVSTIQFMYQHAKNRLVKVASAMDRIELARSTGETRARFQKRIQYFLLHSLLGLTVGEIAKLCGAPHGLVSRGIRVVRDQLLTGEIDFRPDATDAERAQALRRLAAKRKETGELAPAPRPAVPIAILARSNQFFNKQQRWFLMRYLFQMTLTEIAEQEGAQVSNVKHGVQTVADQIILGSVEGFLGTFHFTEDEIQDARQRVERKREKHKAVLSRIAEREKRPADILLPNQ